MLFFFFLFQISFLVSFSDIPLNERGYDRLKLETPAQFSLWFSDIMHLLRLQYDKPKKRNTVVAGSDGHWRSFSVNGSYKIVASKQIIICKLMPILLAKTVLFLSYSTHTYWLNIHIATEYAWMEIVLKKKQAIIIKLMLKTWKSSIKFENANSFPRCLYKFLALKTNIDNFRFQIFLFLKLVVRSSQAL